MFVYQGKLNWYHYAQNETFVIILPSGPARVGDSVYLFSQWTVDAKGNKNANWFSTLTVDSVTQTQGADVTFFLKGSWYNFTITTSQGYEKLSVVMRNPQNGVSSPLPLERMWKSDQELTGTTRVWTGKFKWLNFAKDEPAIFIVPDGFGEGKPILSTWQWTKASNGKTKDPSFRAEVQKSVSGVGTDTVKFTYKSYYDINCTWDGKKDQLDVWVKEGGHSEDVGDMIRSAIIERQAHSHDFNPPEPASEKRELEVSKPQPQASLPRILDPLPFPKGLLETLAHTAAFVDQCGYLAKYAQDRFTTLDADYHVALQQIKALKAEIINLTATKESLTVDRDAAKAEAKKKQEDLDNASKKVQELQDQVAKLNKDIHNDAIKDEAARKVLEKTQADLKASQDEVKDLKQKVTDANAEDAKKQTYIDGLLLKISNLETAVSRLQTALDVETKANAELNKEKNDLILANQELQKSVNQLQKQAALDNGDLEDLREANKKQARRITDLVSEVAEANKRATKAENDLTETDEKLLQLRKKARAAGVEV